MQFLQFLLSSSSINSPMICRTGMLPVRLEGCPTLTSKLATEIKLLHQEALSVFPEKQYSRKNWEIRSFLFLHE
jgi:hypothetical protein